VSLDKLLPQDWHFSIPVGLNYRKSVQEPRFSYLANDLELSETDREKQKTTNISKSYTLHMSKSNSKNWFLKQTIDRLSFDHDRSNSYSKSTHSCDTSQIKNYRGTYALDPKFDFTIFRQTFSLLPQNLSFSAIYTDNSVRSYYRPDPDSAFELSTYATQRRKTLNPSVSVTYSPHTILNTSYNFSQARDSVSQKRRFGEEIGRNQTFNASAAQDLKIISPRLTLNSSYEEDHRFEIRQDEDLRNVSNTGRYGIDGQVNVKGIVTFFTGLRDESKDSLAVAGSPAWVAKQIEKFISYIQNPTITYSKQRSSSYLNVKVRPDIRYQWGLVDTIPTEQVAAGSYPGRNMSETYGVTSGASYKLVSLSGGYNGQVSRSFSYGGNETRMVSFSYPNASIRISGLEALPFLKKYSRSSSVNTGFNQSIERRYDVSNDSLDLRSDSKTISLNPVISWQSNWLKGISTTVDVNYSETNSNEYGEAVTVPSKSTSRGGSASFAYTFSAPRGLSLPFLKGVRFASNLSLNVSVNYSRNTSYFLDLKNPTNDSSMMGTNLGLSYNFSSNITGGANVDYTQNKERNSNQDSKRIGLNFWVNINF
jgi:hypothetical protein